jgi:hypothetical protein
MPADQVKIKKESESSAGLTCCSDGEHYPYGTSLSFDNDLIDELDAGALAVGDLVEVRGFAFVDNTSEYNNKEGTEKSIRLQMTSISLRREADDRVKQLYGGE